MKIYLLLLMLILIALPASGLYPDTLAPSIVSVTASTDPQKVIVTFDDELEASSAQAVVNYTIYRGKTVFAVISAALASNMKAVTLTLSSTLSNRTSYSLRVINIRDTDIPMRSITDTIHVPFTYTTSPVSADQDFTLLLEASNNAPVITGCRSIFIPVNKSFTFNISDFTVTDPDNSYPGDFTLRIRSGTNYSVVSSTITPASNFHGVLQVPVRMFDGTDSSNVFTVQVIVKPVWKIMPLGNSITEAGDNKISYRCWLWRSLVDNGALIDFVGSRSGVFAGYSNAYPQPAKQMESLCPYYDFDEDHEGHTAWKVDELLFGSTNSTYGYPGKLGDWARLSRPDVVLLHGGTNDVVFQGESEIQARDDLSKTIDTLQRINSRIIILLAQIIPTANANNTKVTQLNTLLPVLAAQKSTSAHPVLIVDQNTGFNASTDCIDGIHPNTGGEQKMAEKWYDALKNFITGSPYIFGQRSFTTKEDTRLALSLDSLIVVDIDDTFPKGFTMSILPGSNYSVSGNEITPSQDYTGLLNVPVTVSDSTTTSNIFTCVISVTAVNDSPLITSTPSTTATAHTLYSYQLTASDPENNAVTWSLVSGAPGMVISSAGLLTWTPSENPLLSVPVTVKAKDNGTPACSTQQSFVINVTKVNDPPVITSSPVTTATEHALYQYQAAASDPEGNTIAWTLTNAPSGMVVSADGLISWTPQENPNVTEPVELKAKDNGSPACSTLQTFTIAITKVDDPPVFAAISDKYIPDTASLYFSISAVDPEGAMVHYGTNAHSVLPGEVVFDSTLGAFSWVPPDSCDSLYKVNFSAFDQINKALQSVNIRIARLQKGSLAFSGLDDSAKVNMYSSNDWQGVIARKGNGRITGIRPGNHTFSVVQNRTFRQLVGIDVRAGLDSSIVVQPVKAFPLVIDGLDTARSGSAPLNGGQAAGAAIGDIDANGVADLTIAQQSGKFIRYVYSGTTWTRGQNLIDSTGSELVNPYGISSIKLVDWNHDNRLDIIISDRIDRIVMYPALKGHVSTFGKEQVLYTAREGLEGFDIFDVNNDNMADLTIGYADGTICCVTGSSIGFTNKEVPWMTTGTDTINAGDGVRPVMFDMNGDGIADCIGAKTSGEVVLFQRDSSGYFAKGSVLNCNGHTFVLGTSPVINMIYQDSIPKLLCADHNGIILTARFGLQSDMNKDGLVDIIDLQHMAFSWGTSVDDLAWSWGVNLSTVPSTGGRQVINLLDLQIMARNWGTHRW